MTSKVYLQDGTVIANVAITYTPQGVLVHGPFDADTSDTCMEPFELAADQYSDLFIPLTSVLYIYQEKIQ